MNRIGSWLGLAGIAFVIAACGSGQEWHAEPGGIGDACSSPVDCRAGLVCRGDSTCGPSGLTPEGENCTFTEDCAEGLYCAWAMVGSRATSTCRQAGAGGAGDPCGGTEDCSRGLVCAPAGFGGACVEAGSADLTEPCTRLADCYAGLVCNSFGVCTESASATGGPGYPFWPGVECVQEPDDSTGRFYFEIPRGDLEPGHDFFRLPWPNDARRNADGSINLGGFPHPALAGIDIDVVDRFLRAAEDDLDGFGTYGAVFFRTSRMIDFDSLDASWIYLVDLTPPTNPEDDYTRLGYGWAAATMGGPYICPNWVALRPPRAQPLMPARTYAVVVTRDVRMDDGVDGSATGEQVAQDADFTTMLETTRPDGADPAVLRAWDAYAPFRTFLAAESIDSSTIAAAAVFTTQDVPKVLRSAKAAVDAADAPVLSNLVLCDASVASPCDDGLTGDDHVRGCFAADDAFYEIQGRFHVPIFQQGDAPYAVPEDGGGFGFDAEGNAEIQRWEDVCFSLTIPKGVAMPADGWPVVVYTHGTGGSYRSAATNGVAETMASITLDGGSTVGAAVFAWDQVQHGARRGPSEEDPEFLFFNFVNPGAAWGNVLQGAVDGFQAARLLGALDWDAATSPIAGTAVGFDADRLYYYGHSQGSTHGILTTAVDPAYDAVILSGAGSSLIDSLLTKTSPINIAGAVRMALADATVGELHPALTVLQMYMERADPVNYGRYLVWEPFDDNPSKHVLHFYGVGDTYSTRPTLLTTGAMLGAQIGLEPGGSIIDMTPDEAAGWPTTTLPASGNRTPRGVETTVVMSQHDPLGAYDGHFVTTRDASAIRRIAQFIGTAISEGTPTVVP